MTDAKQDLDTATDRALAFAARSRENLARSAEGRFLADLGDTVADAIGLQFAGTPDLGRILVSSARVLLSIKSGTATAALDAESLLSVLALAGERLDREACDA